MHYTPALIPAKFLALVAHLAICCTLLWNSPKSAMLCSDGSFGPAPTEALLAQQNQLAVGLLCASVGLIAFELLALVAGATMFDQTSAFTSVICHASACLYLSCSALDGWHCEWFWAMFATCSAVPATYDLCTVVDVLIKRKY